ncbi:hypothetical protein SCH01S_28_00870 [Sphingomonas changbaiensis NBRC 104936]|uniref:Uncharacterized protein n=1 Tax=Sphingomonas changbaiensis NBRC 104936 TaxID=1219043 RepID=A0A0E9MNZ4_9SPHN|nr:hypothetical protein [Sphingomonas changbaiensis]GAO39228.1 hypothetical protein SCH01S_28_00870 [Sphingomonas changbaiensis NBRC 104936]
MPQKWNLVRAAAYGAFFGLLVGVWHNLTDNAAYSSADNIEMTGGSVIGGALLFFVVAAGRNALVRAR